jgi:hypothetical protein
MTPGDGASALSFADDIAEAIQGRVLTRLEREDIEAGHIISFVLVATGELLLLAVVSDEIWLDGFTVLRTADLTDVKVPTPHHDFQQKALELRGESPTVPEIDMTSIVTIIRSAADWFPLITVHCEVRFADCCYIGRVLDVDDERLLLTIIDPDARWDLEEPDQFLIEDITRVDFGGQYEDALYRVGGEPGGE